jgi:hypothetical protein
MKKSIAPATLIACTFLIAGCSSTDRYYIGPGGAYDDSAAYNRTGTAYTADGSSTTSHSRSGQDAAYQEVQRSNVQVTRVNSAAAMASAPVASARGASVSPPMGYDASSLPPNPRAGECYARVVVPAEYKTITEEVLIADAAETVAIIPAQYETVQERVLVSEGGEKLEVIPAEYKTVTEKVMVSPPSYRLEEVPPEYEMVTEQVKVRDAAVMWKKGRGPSEKIDNATGEILCLVEVPAEYKTIQKRVLKTPASTKRVEIPGQFETVAKRVMVKPPETLRVAIPAEYKNVPVQKVTVPEQRKVTPVPAQYQTITKQVMVASERTEWRRILCETNMTAPMIVKIQEALRAAGYNPGNADGKIGPLTAAAIQTYQLENNLATGGITYETLQKLGVQL